MAVNIKELTDSRDTVNKMLERFGVRFGVYKKGVFNEQLFPFDSVPRIISKKDWDYLERGLKQRVEALNMFLWDIYHDKRIVKTEWCQRNSYILPKDICQCARASALKDAFIRTSRASTLWKERTGNGMYWRTICVFLLEQAIL